MPTGASSTVRLDKMTVSATSSLTDAPFTSEQPVLRGRLRMSEQGAEAPIPILQVGIVLRFLSDSAEAAQAATEEPSHRFVDAGGRLLTTEPGDGTRAR